MSLYLLYENLLFLAIATICFALFGWAWRKADPYYLPSPLPNWFKIWFLTMQVGGGAVPLVALMACFWQGYTDSEVAWLQNLLLAEIV